MAKVAAAAPPSPAKTLATILGSAALATAAMAGLQRWEGVRLTGYRDVVGVVTACEGVTGPDAKLGRVYTVAQCEQLDEAAAAKHASGVRACTPGVAGSQLVAATLLAYNIGVDGYCRSSIARRFNAGDRRGACDAFLLYDRAGGRELPGLANRRRYERALCLGETPAR